MLSPQLLLNNSIAVYCCVLYRSACRSAYAFVSPGNNLAEAEQDNNAELSRISHHKVKKSQNWQVQVRYSNDRVGVLSMQTNTHRQKLLDNFLDKPPSRLVRHSAVHYFNRYKEDLLKSKGLRI